MKSEPKRSFWWRLLRLQPFGSDSSWRFQNPYLSSAIVLVGIPMGFTAVRLMDPGAGLGWAAVAFAWLAWTAALGAARRLDRYLMREDARP